ncbi:GAF domain-containing protein [Meiothermus taiwanensis]|uniref:Metal dependent phosphohydrolase n=1 Tax=Meiothermus taiwanensis WR-220 TaxID=1339250 RepID=A0ABN5LYY1_9DEIN|nr:GAF domain-containing protein [Meiothermus taiwanensis]AWR87133.1 metal dependent phosphohydrolase [Meiothermus taiwanensis WR-220]
MSSGILERLLGALGQALRPGGDPQSLARRGLSALVQTLDACGAWLRLRENGLSLLAAVGVEPPEEAHLTPQEAEALAAGHVLVYRLPEEATGPASAGWGALGYQGLILAPLHGGGELLGTLALLFAERPPPVARALEEVLPLFGLLLERARAEEELVRRQRLLEALHQLDRAMLEEKSLLEVARIGAEAAQGLLKAQAVAVSLVEKEGHRLVAAVGGALEPLVGQLAPLGEGFYHQAWRSGEPALLPEIPGQGMSGWLLALAPFKNALILPLKPDGTTLGFVGLYGLGDPDAARPLAQSFAAQLSLALLHEQNREALFQRAREQEVLLRALEALGEAANPEEAARRLGALALELLPSEWAAVLLLEQGVLRVAAASGAMAGSLGLRIPPDQGLSWAALRQGTQVVADTTKDPRVYTPPEFPTPLVGSEVVTPLPGSHGEALGVLIVFRSTLPYTPQEARLVEALAQAGATALQRAQHNLEARLMLEGALLVAQEPAPESLIQGFAQLMAQVVGGGRAAIWAHPEGRRPWRLLGVAGVGAEAASFFEARLDPEAGGWTGWIYRQQRPLVIEDVASPPVEPAPVEASGLRLYGVQSVLGVAVGNFGVAYAEPGSRGKFFASFEVTLLERLAGMLAGGLERHRLAVAEQRVRRALERLAQVPPGDLEALVRALGESLGVRWAFIDRLITPERALAVAVYGGASFEYDLPGTPCADVFAGNFCEYPRGVTACFPEDRLAAEMGAEAYLGVPLRGEGGRVLGILVAMHDAPLPEDERDLRREIVLAYAQRAALELGQQENRARLEATARVHSLLRPAQNSQEVIQIAVEAVLRETRATTALLSLYRENGDYLEVVAAAGYLAEVARGRRMERGMGLSWRVFEEEKPLYFEDASQTSQAIFFSGKPSRAAYLGVPLRDAQGRILGVLSADTAEQGGVLFPEDRHFLVALAEATGAAMARLDALHQARMEARRFRVLAELSARLEGLEAPKEILEEALEALYRISGFQVACFHEVAPEGLRLLMVAGEPSEDWLQQAWQQTYPPGHGLRGQVLLTGEALYVPHYPDHPRALAASVAMGLKCAAYTPVRFSEQTVGVLSLLDFRAAYLEDPLPLLNFAARRLANALEKAENLQQLRTTREEALKALGLALEYRDLETAGHTERVTRLALELAEEMGLSEPDLTHLRWGAYLHDLGKLAIPDGILKKPGKLEPEEWEQMKTHTVLGEQMARRMGFLPPATLAVIRHHHERWDGSGYPDGLAGEAIPLLARIFALADVYDALTSQRPYKRAWSPEEALADIAAQAGRHFDPNLCRIFLRRLGRA